MKLYEMLFIMLYMLAIPTVFLVSGNKPDTIVKGNLFIIVVLGLFCIVSTYLDI